MQVSTVTIIIIFIHPPADNLRRADYSAVPFAGGDPTTVGQMRGAVRGMVHDSRKEQNRESLDLLPHPAAGELKQRFLQQHRSTRRHDHLTPPFHPSRSAASEQGEAEDLPILMCARIDSFTPARRHAPLRRVHSRRELSER